MQMRANRSLSRKHLCSNQGTKNSSKSAWRTFSCVKLEILRCRDAELWLNLDEARTTNRKHMTTELTAAVAQRPVGSKTEQMLQETRKESPENGFVARHCASSKVTTLQNVYFSASYSFLWVKTRIM